MAWTSPRTWVAGETVTAALLNTHVRDNLKMVGDPWAAYTPTLTGTGTTQGNATMTGRYRQVNKTVDFWARAVLGSTSVIGTSAMLLLPATATGTPGTLYGRFDDTGTQLYFAWAAMASTSTVQLYVIGTNGAAVTVGSTVPFTWTTGDILFAAGTYEAA